MAAKSRGQRIVRSDRGTKHVIIEKRGGPAADKGGGRIVDRPSNLGGDNGGDGSGQAPKKGE